MKILSMSFLFLLTLSSKSVGQDLISIHKLPELLGANSFVVSPDGQKIIFSRIVKRNVYEYYASDQIDASWSKPYKIHLLNNMGSGSSSFNFLLGFDGQHLYFTRPFLKSKGLFAIKGYETIFKSTYVNGNFEIPITTDISPLMYLGNPYRRIYLNDSKVYETIYLNKSWSDPEEILGLNTLKIRNIKPVGSNALIYKLSENAISNDFLLSYKINKNWSIPIRLNIDANKNLLKKLHSVGYSEETFELYLSDSENIYVLKFPDNIIALISHDYTQELPEVPLTQPNTLQVKKKDKVSLIPTYYALLIAIEDYQNNEPDLVDLSNPINDANNLKIELVSNYNFEEANIKTLKNPNRADIIDAFENISNQITEKDNLLIFYAGHGVWNEKLNIGYWLPSDASTESKSKWISNSTVRDYIAGLNTKHTLLITDACFSGSIFKTREIGKSIDDYGYYRLNKLPSRKAMTSGTLNTVPDNSKFMKYLLKALSANEKEYFPSKQLFHEIEIKIINNTSNVPQFGTIQNTGDEGGDFIFIKRKGIK